MDNDPAVILGRVLCDLDSRQRLLRRHLPNKFPRSVESSSALFRPMRQSGYRFTGGWMHESDAKLQQARLWSLFSTGYDTDDSDFGRVKIFTVLPQIEVASWGTGSLLKQPNCWWLIGPPIGMPAAQQASFGRRERRVRGYSATGPRPGHKPGFRFRVDCQPVVNVMLRPLLAQGMGQKSPPVAHPGFHSQ